MQRVMIIGQPGSGKSTLAREMGEITKLPVFHIDKIHYLSGWVERTGAAKDRLCAEVHAREQWIFEGGRSSTWPERLARADTLIWLDMDLPLRTTRALVRSVRFWGRTRPDLPDNSTDGPSLEFLRYIWRTRHSARARMQALFDAAPPAKTKLRFTSSAETRAYLDDLRIAVSWGNLGLPHR